MKLIHIVIIAIALFTIGTITFAARTTPSYFDQSGTVLTTENSIVPGTDSTYGLGTNSARWATAYIDALHSETITIDGTSAGDLDMSGHRVLNIGTSTTDFTATGGLNLSDSLGIGTTTPAGDIHIYDTASSTMAIGDATHTSCFVLGDSDGAGVSYITILDGTVVATTTKPAICK